MRWRQGGSGGCIGALVRLLLSLHYFRTSRNVDEAVSLKRLLDLESEPCNDCSPNLSGALHHEILYYYVIMRSADVLVGLVHDYCQRNGKSHSALTDETADVGRCR